MDGDKSDGLRDGQGKAEGPARTTASAVPVDGAAALRALLWQRPVAALTDWVQGAAGATVLSRMSEAEALRALAPPPAAANRSVARLTLLANLLRGRGAFRLRMQALVMAEQCGLDPGTARLRQFETMAEAENWIAVPEIAAECMALPTLPPDWRATIQRGILSMLAAERASPAETARIVLRATGLHFLDEIAARIGVADAGVGLATLVLAGEPHRARIVQAALAMSLRGLRDGAALLARSLPDGTEKAQVAAAALAVGDADTTAIADHAERVAAIAAGGGAAIQLMPLTVALVLAMCGHRGVADAARQAVRRAVPEQKLAELLVLAAPRPDAVRAFTGALAQAGCSPLVLLDAEMTAGAGVTVEVARMVLGRRALGAPIPRDQLVRPLQAILQASEDAPELRGLLAEVCRRHAAALAGSVQGAVVLARALTLVQDWEGSLDAWDQVIAQSRSPAWALTRAYLAAARLGRADLAHGYLDRIGAVPGGAQSESHAVNLAYGACLLGDLALARRFMAEAGEAGGLPQQGGLAGRLRTVLTGQIDGAPTGTAVDAAAPGPAALVIDPGFAVNAGHHMPYTQFAVGFLAQELGVAVEKVWACLRRDPPGADDPDIGALQPSLQNLLQVNPYAFEEFPKTPEIVANVALAVEADLDQALGGADLRQVRAVYCHSMKSNMVAGFARWIVRRFAGQPVVVIVGVIEVDFLNLAEEVQAVCRAQYRAGLQLLQDAPDVSLIVHAETAAACAALTAAAGPGIAVHQLPYLASSRLRGTADSPSALAGSEVTVGIVGGSRADRGVELFPELILALSDVPNLRWVVQADRSYLERVDPVLAGYMEWAVRAGICRWHDGRLASEDYRAALQAMDVVLLPYRDRYGVSGSGVFFEAVELGRFLIVPEKTTMHDLLAAWKYPCATMSAPTVGAAERAVRGLLRQKEGLRATMADRGRLGALRPGVADLRRMLHAALQGGG